MLDLAIRGWWQAGNPDARVAFVADVQADQQCGDLLDDACIFQSAAVKGADSRDFRRQFTRELRGIRIIAAHDDIAVEWRVSVE